jgi:hypothetical protein
MNMLANIYAELGDVLNKGQSSGIVPFPQRAASTMFVFVNRSEAGCWYSLDENSNPVYIPNSSGIRGTLLSVEFHQKNTDDYGDKTYLRVFLATDSGKFVIQSGVDSTFSEGVVASLNAFSAAELKDIVIGIKPSDATTGKQAKVVFAQVVLPDGTWKKADREKPFAVAFDEVNAKVFGLMPPALPKQQDFSAPATKKPAPVAAKRATSAVIEPEPDFDESIPF